MPAFALALFLAGRRGGSASRSSPFRQDRPCSADGILRRLRITRGGVRWARRVVSRSERPRLAPDRYGALTPNSVASKIAGTTPWTFNRGNHNMSIRDPLVPAHQ